MSRRLAVSAALAVFILPSPASAHGPRLTTTAGDEAIAGQASFADGTPMVAARIELLAVQGAGPGAGDARRSPVTATTRTDADGRFALPTPLEPGEYRLTVDDGLGHRREARLTLEQGAAVAHLRDDDIAPPHEHPDSPLQRWVSGLGYLLGLSGAAAWWLARREGRRGQG